MAETILNKKKTLKKKVNNFIFDWHRFTIDFWWRKRYHVPFGSKQHREMNFIDMLIEYQEELLINKSLTEYDADEEEIENEILGLTDNSEKKVVKLSESQIDEDFENLDLEQFNKE